MGELLISILIMAAAAMVILPLVNGSGGAAPSKPNTQKNTEPDPRLKPEDLNCRVELIKEIKDGSILESFCVEICGTIRACSGCDRVLANISIADITDGPDKAKPVYSLIEKRQIDSSQIFSCSVELGKLPAQVTTLSDWMAVAKIPADCLVFPLKGSRNLLFKTTILSGQGGAELACAMCGFTYENPAFGYIEREKNIRRAKTLAIALAFAVAAADRKISAHETQIIRNWAKHNDVTAGGFGKIRNKFYRLLAEVLAFFPRCNRIRRYKICERISGTVPLKVRCDIIELCLHAAGSNGTIVTEQLALLKETAGWLGIGRERFRWMAENILPVSMYEAADAEIGLGITSGMSKDQICRQLSKEYRKWNARVTSYNPEIENQAEHMLKLIGELRNQY